MRRLSLPPDIKVLEAAGAIGDDRVRILESDGRTVAEVVSSEGDRRYRVVVEQRGGDTFIVYSDDNGTKFRGYIGYPIIAVLMLRNNLPRDERVEEALKGIKWKQLNQQFKRYYLTKEYVLRRASTMVPLDYINEYVRRVMNKLRMLNVLYELSLANA